MADKQTDKRADPAEAFQKLLTEWERNFDAMANRFMGTEEFSKSMNQFQNLQLELQKRFSDTMALQLANLNMPSRDDILRLGESIRRLDTRLSTIEQQLAKKSKKGKKNKRKGPPRTKLPPSQQAKQSDHDE